MGRLTKLVDLFLLLLLLLLVLGCTLCFLFFNCLFNLFWSRRRTNLRILGGHLHQSIHHFLVRFHEVVDFTGKQIVQHQEYLPLLFAGIATSTFSNGESESQNAMTGMLTLEASLTACESVRGSVTIKSLGSLKFCVIWLVKVPGVYRFASACAPVYVANFNTARPPYGRADTARTSAAFSMVTMMRAAKWIFSQVLPTLMMWIPSERLLQT